MNSTKRTSHKSSAKERKTIPTGLHVFDVRMNMPGCQIDGDEEPNPEPVLQPDVTSKIDKFLDTAPQALDFGFGKHLSVTLGL